jgi:hypothetical protein
MLTAEGFINGLERNATFVRNHLNTVTHAEALLQPPYRGNCILWIVGHVVCYRNYSLALVGQPPALPENLAARFARDSAPVLADEPGLATLDTLMAAFEASQTSLIEAARTLTPAQAAEVVTQDVFTMPRGDLLVSRLRHEAYHVGQLEWLREMVLALRHSG